MNISLPQLKAFAAVARHKSFTRAAAELVNEQLVAPRRGAESKRSAFSRVKAVPVQRRVRVLDAQALTDARGKQFVRFAIDERRGWDEQDPWQRDRVSGCAYLAEQKVYVRRGQVYFTAASTLGKAAKEQPGVCRPAAEGAGQIASAE